MKWILYFLSNIKVSYNGGLAIIDLFIWGIFLYALIAEILGYKIILIKK